jgi:O-antigen ligase
MIEIINKYKDHALFVLISFCFAAPYLPSISIAGASFNLFQIVLTFLSVFSIPKLLKNQRSNQLIIPLLVLLLAFSLLSIISALWAEDLRRAIQFSSYWVWALLTVVNLLFLASFYDRKSFLERIEYYTYLNVFTLIAFASFEVISGYHLPSSFSISMADYFYGHDINFMPAATFGNPNNFCLFLTLSALCAVTFFHFKWRYLLPGIALLFAIIASSRLCIMVNIVLFIYILARTWPSFQRLAFLFPIVLLSLIIGYHGLISETAKVQNDDKRTVVFREVLKSELIDTLEVTDSTMTFKLRKESLDVIEKNSNSVRKELSLKAFSLFKSQPILGIGSGQFETKMQAYYAAKDLLGVVNPHNIVLRILAEFGIIGIALFLSFVCWLIVVIRKQNWTIQKSLLFGAILVLFGFFGLIPSALLALSWFWLFLALIFLWFDASDNKTT